MNTLPIRRALISVSDKSGLLALAPLLIQNNIEVISSGGTAHALRELGVPVVPIQEVTGNPEAFGGRMKTLSFAISSALLFRRGHSDDEQQALDLGIQPIDLVICNLYPFSEVVEKGGSFAEKIENIDIGGPTMIRAAAKNHTSVCVVVDPTQYPALIAEWNTHSGTTEAFRQQQALMAFRHTAVYDAHIARQLEQEFLGSQMSFSLDASQATTLRYGENPHQKAWLIPENGGIASAQPIQGVALSYNNMLDADAAYRSCADISDIAPHKHAITIIKHLNPCGAALADNQQEALALAWAGDPISAFGSIICFNQEVEEASVEWLHKKFVEVIIAPSFSQGALERLSKRKKLRLLALPIEKPTAPMIRSIFGGYLLQEEDVGMDEHLEWVCTDNGIPSIDLCSFGIMVTKHLRSNAIALVRNHNNALQLVGAGMGNPNRLISTQQAIEKAYENGITELSSCILISDAFFPFRDNVDVAAKHGIKNIIQPGGSIRDQEVQEACIEHAISMAYTKRRHFRH